MTFAMLFCSCCAYFFYLCMVSRQIANLAGRDGGSGWGLKSEADASPGTKLLDLPSSCHLTYSSSDSEKLLRLIERVPSELWGAKLALQVVH